MTTTERRIGVDASRLSSGPRTGTETYSFELLSALARMNPPDSFELYLNADAPPADLPPLGSALCMPFPRLWTHLRLSARMIRRPPAVLFVPAHVVPVVHPRSVVTIHDLGYLHFPDAHTRGDRRLLDVTTRWSVRGASRVIAISDSTKTDLVNAYGVEHSKISVVPHGVGSIFTPASSAEVDRVRARYGLRAPYLLTVGTIQPRKNIGRQAAAMKILADAGLPHELAVAGGRGWLAEQVEREIAASGADDRVRLLGYVEAADLPALYSGSDVFSFPSLHEGFGLPVLEAMACGTPVVTSCTSALPEVAGDAAVLVDPLDVKSIAVGYLSILENPGTADRLRARGAARAARFSWSRAAAETLAVLREVRDGR